MQYLFNLRIDKEMMLLKFPYWLFIICLLILSACSQQIRENRSTDSSTKLAFNVPKQWQAQMIADLESINPNGWIDSFQDEQLQQLVSEAMQKNSSLQAILAQMEMAQANQVLQGTKILPRLNMNSGVSRAKQTANNTSNRFQLGVDIAWEANLWGRLTNLDQIAEVEYDASQADYYAARLSLAANVARTWFNNLIAEQQWQLSQQQVARFSQSLISIEERYRHGLISALEVRLARESLASAKVNQQQRQQTLDRQKRNLEFLLGRYPNAELEIQQTLPILSESLPVGLPAEILRRRPDIFAAEARLQARIIDVNRTAKNHLPTIRLTGSLGSASSILSNFLSLDHIIRSIAASLVQPIFQADRLEAEKNQAIAQQKRAVARYAETVLTAFQEVETALAAEDFLRLQENSQNIATQEAEEAAKLAMERYRTGLIDILTLLDSQRRQFSNRSRLLDVKQQRLLNRINLHLALGGDFM